MISIRTDFDILVMNGTIVDGTGGEPVKADIGICGDRIVCVGDLSRASAMRKIDCADLCVAPGFIDVHSHSDAYILLQPTAPSKIHQGVTTEIVGQCGASASPLVDGAELPSDWASHTYHRSWRTMEEYRAVLAEIEPLVNIIPMTGHRNLRMAVMGRAARPATTDETEQMARLLASELEQGSVGLTTGLLYQPACHARPEEIHALVRECAWRGAHYATHLRSEGSGLLAAIDEAIEAARQSGVSLQISHLKTSGSANWHLLDAAFARIEAARAEGLRVHADRYPYTAAGTDLDVVLPEWAGRGTRAEILERLSDETMRSQIVEAMMTERTPEYWKTVRVGGTWSKTNAQFRGQDIASIAAAWPCSPAEAVLRIVTADELRTGGFFFGMSEDNLRRIYAHPWVMVGSDASLRAPDGELSEDHPHPRAYGAFPRFLALCRDEQLMSLGEAVRRLTGLPAESFNLAGRGFIRKEYLADLVIFDPQQVKDTATYAMPHSYPTGIHHVISAGRLAF